MMYFIYLTIHKILSGVFQLFSLIQDEMTENLDQAKNSIIKLFTISNLGNLLRVGFLIFIGIPLIYLLSKWVQKYITSKFSAQQGMIFGKIIKYSGMIIIIFSALRQLDFKLTTLIGAAGLVGMAIAFASQTSVSNIISGLFLIMERPFEVGDVISVQTTTGVVLSIDVLSVKLRTFDNKYIRIPNETIIKSEVTNITHFPIRRVDINVGVAYKEDIGRVRKILLNLAQENPLCLNEPEPMVIFSGFGNSSLDLLFVLWATKDDWLKLKNSIAEQIKLTFDKEGIEIPFPHISLYSGSVTAPIPIRIENGNKTSQEIPS